MIVTNTINTINTIQLNSALPLSEALQLSSQILNNINLIKSNKEDESEFSKKAHAISKESVNRTIVFIRAAQKQTEAFNNNKCRQFLELILRIITCGKYTLLYKNIDDKKVREFCCFLKLRHLFSSQQALSQAKHEKRFKESPQLLAQKILSWRANVKKQQEALDRRDKEAIRKIRMAWLDNLNDEANRLAKSCGEMEKIDKATASIKKEFASAFGVTNEMLRRIDPMHARILVGRACEIRNQFKTDFHVFSHGQTQGNSFLTQIIHSLTRLLYPSRYRSLAISLRLPNSSSYYHTVNAFFAQHGKINDHILKDHLLSVDCSFWNITASESALYFAITNSNIHSIRLDLILKNCIESEKIRRKLEVKWFDKILQYESKLGVIYLICIPKVRLRNDHPFVYPSHSFGDLCSHFSEYSLHQILDKAQNDIAMKCKYSEVGPTYRILASRLQREKGVRIFRCSTLSREQRKRFRNQARLIAREISVYVSLEKYAKILPTEKELKELCHNIQALGKIDRDTRTTMRECLENTKLSKEMRARVAPLVT